MDKTLSGEFLLTVFDSLAEAIKMIDDEFTVFYSNHAANQLINREDSDRLKITDPVFEKEGELIHQHFDKLKQGEMVEAVEFIKKSGSGDNRLFEFEMIPIKGDNQQVNAAIIITRDVSTKKKSEHEMIQRDKLASIGQIASSLAHEIRNPLTGIRLGLNVLKDGLSKEKTEIISSITTDIKRLEDILHSLLDYSKVREKQKEKTDINHLIKECIVLLGKQAENSQIEIKLDLSEIIPKAIVDPHEIKQVIINLVLNSIQAIEQKGTINIRTSNMTVNQTLGLLITIEDDGPGIDPENFSNINNLFFTTKKDGTGLGLPMANKIIHEHDGSIVFEKEKENGTLVKVFIPIEIQN